MPCVRENDSVILFIIAVVVALVVAYAFWKKYKEMKK